MPKSQPFKLRAIVNRFFLASLFVLSGCAAQSPTPHAASAQPVSTASVQDPNQVQQLTWTVARDFPHDTSAFTEGLLWKDGYFYESTGLEGKSDVRKVDPASGQVLQRLKTAPQYFGEGLSFVDGHFYNLTWRTKVGFMLDDKLKPLARFTYEDEGWGLTTDGQKLLQSDGTDTLTWRNPKDFSSLGKVKVKRNGVPVSNLNELEWIRGYVWANVWQTDEIVVIDPTSGNVVAVLDMTGLLKASDRTGGEDVLNGIAYDAASDRIFVTGKNWPKMYWINVSDEPHKN